MHGATAGRATREEGMGGAVPETLPDPPTRWVGVGSVVEVRIHPKTGRAISTTVSVMRGPKGSVPGRAEASASDVEVLVVMMMIASILGW